MNGRDVPSDEGPNALLATQIATAVEGDNVVELDQLFAKPTPAGLRVGITGNLPTDGTALALLIDAVPGGQDALRTATVPAPPNGVAQLEGLVMDVGFTPEQMFWINGYLGNLYVDQFTLPTSGAPVHRYVGSSVMNAASGDLSGGTNPNAMQVAFNDSNSAGITSASVASASTATRGLETVIPWADLGVPAGSSLKLLAAIVGTDGNLTSQFLPGTGYPLGYAPTSLRTVAGTQYVTVPAAAGVPLPKPTALAFASSPNPFRDTTTLRFTLPRAGSVRIDLLDASGRRVRVLGPAQVSAGAQRVTWDGRDEAGRRVAPGVYLARLTAGTDVRQAKVIRMR